MSDAATRKQAIQAVFDRAAPTYAAVSYFPVLGQWLVDLADLPPGADVLDVACGRGAVLLPAARRVGPHGRVVGVDLSEAMVRATGNAIQDLGLTQASALRMDAEQLELPDASFDSVLCGFSLQFLPRLPHALAEFRRVLRPGGRVLATTWGAQDPSWRWYRDLRTAHEAVLKLQSQALDEPDDLRARFERAGFADVRVVSRELDVVYAEGEEWWAMQWSVSGRAGLERLPPERLAQFKAEVFERMQALRQPDGFHDRLAAHCAVGARP